jgi:hypothetical protein
VLVSGFIRRADFKRPRICRERDTAKDVPMFLNERDVLRKSLI